MGVFLAVRSAQCVFLRRCWRHCCRYRKSGNFLESGHPRSGHTEILRRKSRPAERRRRIGGNYRRLSRYTRRKFSGRIALMFEIIRFVHSRRTCNLSSPISVGSKGNENNIPSPYPTRRVRTTIIGFCCGTPQGGASMIRKSVVKCVAETLSKRKKNITRLENRSEFSLEIIEEKIRNYSLRCLRWRK